MSQMVVVPMKRKMLLRMSGVEMKEMAWTLIFLELMNRIVTEKEIGHGQKAKTSRT